MVSFLRLIKSASKERSFKISVLILFSFADKGCQCFTEWNLLFSKIISADLKLTLLF